MRTTAPAMAPPISAPRWLDDDDGVELESGETVWIMMLVVVMRPPLAADVMTDTTELVLMRLVEDVCAAPPFAFLVVEVDVVADVVADVDVEVGVEEVDEVDELDDDDDVDVVSLVVVSPLPWFPIMAAEATAGPVVLIDATEVPSGNAKKSLELSQQTLDAFRL